jgi:hypothetical protein
MPHVFPAFSWLEASAVSVQRVGDWIEGVGGGEHACVRVHSFGTGVLVEK